MAVLHGYVSTLEITLCLDVSKEHKSGQNLTDFTILRSNLDRPGHCAWAGLAKAMAV